MSHLDKCQQPTEDQMDHMLSIMSCIDSDPAPPPPPPPPPPTFFQRLRHLLSRLCPWGAHP